jgi:hypothetical protein
VVSVRKIQHGWGGMIVTMVIEDFATNVKGTGLNHDDCKWRDYSKIF